MRTKRRSFLTGALASGLLPLAGAAVESPSVKFLLMSDLHVESDFTERGRPVYTMWKPGNHAALVETYAFINRDPFCSDLQFGLFLGDQLNTGYTRTPTDLEAERALYFKTLDTLNLHHRSKKTDLSSFRFSAPDFVCAENLPRGTAPFRMSPPPLQSRVIAIQGNHDTGVREFPRDCVFTCGDTRFICFFASYVGLPAAPGHYNSTAKISDVSLSFAAREMEAAAADPSVRHIVLCSHWAIAPKGPDFVHPLIDACRETDFNDNRRKLLALAEKYGCDLYLNGHEHNGAYPVGKAGCLSDVNCGTVTGDKAAWAVVEIFHQRAVFTVYSRASVSSELDGRVVLTRTPQRLFTRIVPLRPLR